MAEVPRGQDRPILVFAGTTRQARDWIVARGISPAWCTIITPNNFDHFHGAYGNPHVILCGQLSHAELEQIQEFIAITASPPLEDVDGTGTLASVACGPGPDQLA